LIYFPNPNPTLPPDAAARGETPSLRTVVARVAATEFGPCTHAAGPSTAVTGASLGGLVWELPHGVAVEDCALLWVRTPLLHQPPPSSLLRPRCTPWNIELHGRGGGGLRAAVGTYAPAAPTPTVVTAPASLHSFGTTSFTGLRRPGCYALGSMGVRVALGTGCNRVSLIGRAWRNARVSSSLISFVRFAPNQITIPVITVPVTRPGSGLRGCGYKFHSVEPVLLGRCASDHDS
jgi:hypothetical protein